MALSLENADFFDELRASYEKLEGLERTKSKILHRLSHELRTPARDNESFGYRS